MQGEIERKIEPKKEVELNEKIKQQIRSHLEYREGIEKSTLDSARKHLTSPSEIEEHRKLEKFMEEWNQKAKGQLEAGEPDEEILSKLSLPTQEEEKAQKELDMFYRLFAKRGLGKDSKEYIKKQMSLLDGEIKFWRYKREDWVNRLKKSAEKKPEKSKSE